MTFYFKNGTRYNVTAEENVDIREKLPVGTYTVLFDPQRGVYYFDTIDNFSPLGKVYGDVNKRAQRIITTFESRPNATGVILTGEKGSGKTLLAKQISINLAEQGIVTIVINTPHCGEAFNTFMQSIDQPCMVFFDEFEKVYNSEQQDAILTLLDGTFPSKKLFVVTCNESYRLNGYMLNRPGRFFYSYKYAGLEEGFIREYCEDRLNDKEQIESIVRYSSTFNAFNFDMLKAIVEELNRYEETLYEAVQHLNINPMESNLSKYGVVELQLKGKNHTVKEVGTVGYGNHLNPYESKFYVNYTYEEKEDLEEGEEPYDDSNNILFDPSHIVSVLDSGKILFENHEARVIIERKRDKGFELHEKFLL